MGWNELTARAPLMLGLIGMLAAGDFFISWLQLTTNLAGSADLGFIIVHMTFAIYITRVVLLQDTDLRKGPMAAYIGHSFFGHLSDFGRHASIDRGIGHTCCLGHGG